MNFQDLNPYLGSIEKLTSMGKADKLEYVQPALNHLGSISIVMVREVISPASFRNADAEVTDIHTHGVRRVRAVANKFKYGERKRGLQILRMFNAGGNMAQNRIEFGDKDKPSSGFDLNSVVFGDSANKGKFVLPVKAAALYSDALSIQPYVDCVDASFHIRSSEDGTLWDATKKKNTDNLFERHFIVPGTIFLQVITLNGKTAPVEALKHLCLAIGTAGAYGGGTSVYGINVRNHNAGIYAGKFERHIASPYEALKEAELTGKETVPEILQRIGAIYSAAYPTTLSGEEVTEEVSTLIEAVEKNDSKLAESYQITAEKVAEFFDGWFGV